MKTNIVNHAFSLFLAENQRPMTFQKPTQIESKAISNQKKGE